MRNSPWYIPALLVLISGVAGYTYLESHVQTLQVTGKRLEDGRSRYGIASSRYVLETDKGEFRLLTFPVLGFTFGAEEVYESIATGDSIEARVGYFPPAIFNSGARPQIMALY